MLTGRQLKTFPLLNQFLVKLAHGFQERIYHPEDLDQPLITLGHITFALLLHHEICPKSYKPIYLIAGTEDLRCLLPHLDLAKENAEAIVWIRPYIHSMALHFKRTKDGLSVIFFDPQDWGLQYYPNRNILEILKHFFPDITIRVLPKMQLRDGTCALHVFNFIEMMSTQDPVAFAKMTDKTTEETYSKDGNTYTVHRIVHVPDQITAIAESDIQRIPGALLKLQQRILNSLEKEILPTYVKQSDKFLQDAKVVSQVLDLSKIMEVPHRLGGLALAKPILSLQQPVYQVTPDAKTASLVVRFTNPNQMRYGNLFRYSPAIYPFQVRDGLVKQETLLAGLMDEQKCTLTLTHQTWEELLFKLDLLQTELLVAAPYMRQDLALKTFIQHVQQAIYQHTINATEFAEVKDHGISFEKYVDALRFVFQNSRDITFVAGYYNPANIATEALALIDSNKSSTKVIFPYQTENPQHAMLIVVDTQQKQVRYLDSFNTNITSLPLLKEFRERGYQMTVGSHYALQPDLNDPYCVVHGFKNALVEAGVEQVPTSNTKLEIDDKLVTQIFVAAALGEKLSPVKRADNNWRGKKVLLLALEEIRQQKGTYPDKDDELKALADALQIELYGDLKRGSKPDDFKGRQKNTSHTIADRSFEAFCKDFCDKNPQGRFQENVLKNIKHINRYANNAVDQIKKLILQLLDENNYNLSTERIAGLFFNDYAINSLIRGALSLDFMSIEDAKEMLHAHVQSGQPLITDEIYNNLLTLLKQKMGSVNQLSRDLLENFMERQLRLMIFEANLSSESDLLDVQFAKIAEQRQKRLAPYLEAKCITPYQREQFLKDEYYPIFTDIDSLFAGDKNSEALEVKTVPFTQRWISYPDELIEPILKFLLELREENYLEDEEVSEFDIVSGLIFDKQYQAIFSDLKEVHENHPDSSKVIFAMLAKSFKETFPQNAVKCLAVLAATESKNSDNSTFVNLAECLVLLNTNITIDVDILECISDVFQNIAHMNTEFFKQHLSLVTNLCRKLLTNDICNSPKFCQLMATSLTNISSKLEGDAHIKSINDLKFDFLLLNNDNSYNTLTYYIKDLLNEDDFPQFKDFITFLDEIFSVLLNCGKISDIDSFMQNWMVSIVDNLKADDITLMGTFIRDSNVLSSDLRNDMLGTITQTIRQRKEMVRLAMISRGNGFLPFSERKLQVSTKMPLVGPTPSDSPVSPRPLPHMRSRSNSSSSIFDSLGGIAMDARADVPANSSAVVPAVVVVVGAQQENSEKTPEQSEEQATPETVSPSPPQ